MKEQIYNELLSILNEMGKDTAEITMNSKVGIYSDSDFDFSSLDKIEFIVKIEEKYCIEFDMENIELVTMKEYVEFINHTLHNG